MKIANVAAAIAAVIVLGIGTPAAAREPGLPFVPTGAYADAPNGYVEMCRRDAALCTGPAIFGSAVRVSPTGRCASPLTEPVSRTRERHPIVNMTQEKEADDPAPDPGCTGALRPAIASDPPSIAGDTGAVSSVTPAKIAVQSPRRQFAAARREPGGRPDRDLLEAVTRRINRAIGQRTDLDLYGVGEFWERPGASRSGDCEDIAIEKRIILVASGFPPERLSYAVVFGGQVGLHVVLVARLSDGDYVLDSLSPSVRRWSQSPYRWLRLQSRDDPSMWLEVRQS